jgi:hypothetical protein
VSSFEKQAFLLAKNFSITEKECVLRPEWKVRGDSPLFLHATGQPSGNQACKQAAVDKPKGKKNRASQPTEGVRRPFDAGTESPALAATKSTLRLASTAKSTPQQLSRRASHWPRYGKM